MKISPTLKLDVVIGMIVLIVVVMLSLGLGSQAKGGEVCNNCRAPAFKQIVAPAYPVYYSVGQSLQSEALSTQQFRQSDEYIELQQLRGYRAGVEAATRQQSREAPAESAPEQSQEQPPAADFPLPAPPANEFSARFPMLATHCSRCHTGDNPKGETWIDPTVVLSGPDAAARRAAIATEVIMDRMPKDRPLDAQAKFDLLVELFRE